MTRQQRRQAERKAVKLESFESKKQPSSQRTSSRWLGRTKGMPFSNSTLERIIPSSMGIPAQFVTSSNTRNTAGRVIRATNETIGWFFTSIPDSMRQALLGKLV